MPTHPQPNPPLHTFGTPPQDGLFATREAVYAVVREKDMIAAVHTPRGYFLPGGGVEENETIFEALVREVFEELGWAIYIHDPLPVVEQYLFSAAKQQHILTTAHFYHATFCAEICEPLEDEHKLIWLHQSEAEEKLFTESMRWAVKQPGIRFFFNT